MVVRRWSIAALFVTGCTFSGEPLQGEPTDDGADGGVTAPTARCGISDPNVVLCLDFDGDPITDGSGRQHDPLVTAVVPGTRGTEAAAVLSPASIIQVPETTDFDLLDKMTIEMWMRPELPTRDFYLLDNHGQYSMMYRADGKVRCGLAGGATADTILLPPNNWYHLGCTYDGATLKVYVDGVLAACKRSSQPMSLTGTLGLSIGVNTDPGPGGTPAYKDHFEGIVDNVHVFSRVLNTTEMCNAAGQTGCLQISCPDE